MARPRLTDTDALIKAAEKYAAMHPGMRIRVSKLGAMIRGNGIPVKDVNIRRNKEFMAYLEELNSKVEKETDAKTIVFEPVDPELFLQRNRNREQLKKAIMDRDAYYGGICRIATSAAQEKKRLERQNASLIRQNEEKQAEIDKLSKKLRTFRDQSAALLKMKKVMEMYVYPDAASAILQKAGIIDTISTLVAADKIDSITLRADTNIEDVMDLSEEMEAGPKDSLNETRAESAKDLAEDSLVEPPRHSKYRSIDKMLSGFDDISS